MRHSPVRRASGNSGRGLRGGARRAGEVRRDIDLSVLRLQILGAINWTMEWYKPGKRSIEQIANQVFEKDLDRIRIEDLVRAEDQVVPLYLKMLERELHGEGLGEKLYIESICSQLAIHLLRHYAHVEFRSPKLGSLSPHLRRTLIEFIDENLTEDITLDDLAGLAGLSTYHFSRKFKADLGMAPHAYVISRRVEKAKRLLKSDRLPLKFVAAECGFTDQSHLSRIFRKLLGVTPNDFRKSL